MHFLLKGPFGDFEQKTWWLQLLYIYIYSIIYIVFITEKILRVAIKSWPE